MDEIAKLEGNSLQFQFKVSSGWSMKFVKAEGRYINVRYIESLPQRFSNRMWRHPDVMQRVER